MANCGVRVWFSNTAEPDEVWSNTIEFVTESTLEEPICASWTGDLATFFGSFMYDGIFIDRAEFYTWSPDSRPYNPAALVVIPIEEVGLRDLTGEILAPLYKTVFIRKQTLNGRLGKMFMRGALTVDDIEVVNGKERLTTGARATLVTLIQGWNETIQPDLISLDFQPCLIGRFKVEDHWTIAEDGKPVNNPDWTEVSARRTLDWSIVNVANLQIKNQGAMFGRRNRT